MKSRIVQELHAIAAGEDTEYMNMLSQELRLPAVGTVGKCTSGHAATAL